MRGVFTLVLVFGAVAFVFVAYWLRRGAAAAREAGEIYTQTGSLSETAKILFQHERQPDAFRLSANQARYLDHNIEEFKRLHGVRARALAMTFLDDYLERLAAEGKQLSSEEQTEAVQSALNMAMRHLGKEWCAVRGVQ